MRGLGELYEEIILDHYRNPRNNEELDNPDAEIEANNPFCGDEVKIQLRFQDGRIDEIGVTGRGCAISKSSASLLSELAEGRTQDELSRTTKPRPAHDEGRESNRGRT
ncbi:Iron-sulfur cluster assembly scaffold protein IscU 2 [Geodia barretti]|uniref:Iron-sulfur cluster assembly scaffold protein IscU 2 n=1 Tax=Geodia barretti TaxID=519541 RepID=A0AA35W5S3_GEOBA|nr:Iron-sulfur cluster assembly scaffold protein IscU 2 [Geodia barretti]